jgi:Uma2 family endonuclease
MRTLTIDNTKEWTVEDYLLLGEMNTPCQLINGELIMSPAPHPNHQRVSGKLYKILDKALQDSGEVFYAPIDLYINNKNVFQPDLVYLSNANKFFLTDRGIEGAADIVVEIKRKKVISLLVLRNIGSLILETERLKSIHLKAVTMFPLPLSRKKGLFSLLS